MSFVIKVLAYLFIWMEHISVSWQSTWLFYLSYSAAYICEWWPRDHNTVWMTTDNAHPYICQFSRTTEEKHTRSKNFHKAKLFKSHNTVLTSMQWVDHLFSQTVWLCMCVCAAPVYILAKFVPLSGGPLWVTELQQAAGHSKSILFDQHSLDLHVKQLFILDAAGKREKWIGEGHTEGGVHKHLKVTEKILKSYISNKQHSLTHKNHNSNTHLLMYYTMLCILSYVQTLCWTAVVSGWTKSTDVWNYHECSDCWCCNYKLKMHL